MATPQTATAGTTKSSTMGNTQMTETTDKAESLIRTIDQSTKESTGISLFHILTLGSIGASLALFFSGNRQAGIFVGLWPPTFQALKSVADTNKENKK